MNLIENVGRLRRYALMLCRNPADADDLVQQTLERALDRAHQFREGADLRAWLFSILHNAFVSDRRTIDRRVRADADLSDAHMPVAGDQEHRAELRQVLARIDLLPDEQRRVLLLVSVEGFTTDEVAELLGIPVGTVRSRLARAREALRQDMAQALSERPLRIVGGRDVRDS